MQTVEYDVLQNSDLQVLASAVKAYLRQGWVTRGDVVEYNSVFTQEMERHPVQAAAQAKQVNRQKSWVPWPKF